MFPDETQAVNVQLLDETQGEELRLELPAKASHAELELAVA